MDSLRFIGKNLLQNICQIIPIPVAVFQCIIILQKQPGRPLKFCHIIANYRVAPGRRCIDSGCRTGINIRFRSALSKVVQTCLIYCVLQNQHSLICILAFRTITAAYIFFQPICCINFLQRLACIIAPYRLKQKVIENRIIL